MSEEFFIKQEYTETDYKKVRYLRTESQYDNRGRLICYYNDEVVYLLEHLLEVLKYCGETCTYSYKLTIVSEEEYLMGIVQ